MGGMHWKDKNHNHDIYMHAWMAPRLSVPVGYTWTQAVPARVRVRVRVVSPAPM